MKKLIVLCLTFAAAMAHATEIGAGTTVTPDEVTTAVGAGSIELLQLSGNYNFNVLPPDISASYVETAYADTTNPFNTISGVYDTAIVLKITVGPSIVPIRSATLAYFGGFESSVSYLAGSSAVPTLASRGPAPGQVIGYTFAGLTQGDVETLIVYTNAVGANYGGRVSIQDGTAGYNAGIDVAPEPRSASLFTGGFAFVAFFLLVAQRRALAKA
jgi:hypothetical protein